MFLEILHRPESPGLRERQLTDRNNRFGRITGLQRVALNVTQAMGIAPMACWHRLRRKNEKQRERRNYRTPNSRSP